MKLKPFFILLLISLTACSAKTPQAVSTPVPNQARAVPTNPSEPTTTQPGTDTLESSATPVTPTPTETLAVTDTPVPVEEVEPPHETANTTLPDPNTASWQTLTENLARPIGIASPDDGSGRLFILEQEGTIRIFSNGELLANPFLDIRDRVGATSSERGLLGLAFHPDYARNGFFYVNYTDLQGDTVIARFQVSGSEANAADPGSELQMLNFDQPYANHNGGGVQFGPDGYLYISLGDGGSGGDPLGNGQSNETLLGKILRIDVDTDSSQSYTIPAGNPFVDGGGRPEIWASGLRNAWRFSFDRLTGDLYIADVGQDQWEEIDFLPAGSPGGANFGWNIKEGTHNFQGSDPGGLIDPIFEYDHSQGCSVTGGVVYRGALLPEWHGVYLFSDFCSGNLWGLIRTPDSALSGDWQNSLLYNGLGSITAFGEDQDGEVYALAYDGRLLKLTPNPP